MPSVLLQIVCWNLLASSDSHDAHVAVNYFDTCFSQYNQVACWGSNEYGQLGRGDTDDIKGKPRDLELILTPIDLGDDFVIKQIAGGAASHHCAVSVDARLKCWGDNDWGLYTAQRTHHSEVDSVAGTRPTRLWRHEQPRG